VAKSDLKFTGDASQLDRELKKTQRELEKQKQKVRDIGTESKKTEGKQKEAFGPGALTQLSKYALGLVSVAGGAAAIAAAFKKINEEREKAAGKLRESEIPLGQLSELAGGDPKELKRLVDLAKGIFVAGGAETLEQGATITYKLESAGKRGDAPLFASLFGTLKDPAAMASAITALQTARGREETGTTAELVSKALVLNRRAPATAPELLQAAAVGGGAAKLLGVSDESLLAAVALTARATSDAAKGGRQVRALLTQLTKRGGFVGKTLEESVLELQARGLNPQEKTEFLGDVTAVSAFETIAENLPEFREIVKELHEAPTSGIIQRTIKSRQQQPGIVAARKARAAAADLEIERIPEAVDALLIESIQNRRASDRIKRFGETGSIPIRAVDAVFDFITGVFLSDRQQARFLSGISGGDEAVAETAEIQNAIRQGRTTSQPIDVNTPALEEVRRNTEALQNNTNAMQGGSQLGPPNEDQGG
jgi:hypothetical protein